eukprot:746324-Amphidinium_carterae.1
MVRHAIQDNLKGFTEEQIHNNIVDGLSLHDRVYAAKKKQLESPGSIITGKRFWSEMRALHGNASHAVGELDMGTDRPSNEIWEGMKAALLRHPPNRAVLMEALSGTSALSLPDFKATGQVLLRLSFGASPEQLQLGLAIARAW